MRDRWTDERTVEGEMLENRNEKGVVDCLCVKRAESWNWEVRLPFKN